MTGIQAGSPDSAFDQPMIVDDEDVYPPLDMARLPPIPPVVVVEIRGTGPQEEGDAIVGAAWDVSEEGLVRDLPAELLVEDEPQEERPWQGAITQVVYHSGRLLGANLSTAKILLVVREAYELYGRVATREQAVAWGEENHPGQSVTTKLEVYASIHAGEVERAGGFEKAVRKKFDESLPNRLNADRVREIVSPLNPDFERMMGLATGIVAPLAQGFVPVSIPPPKTKL